MENTEVKPQNIAKKGKLLRLAVSNKSASDLMPAVREQIAQAVMHRPDAESISRQFGSTVLQTIFSVLHVLLWRQHRLEQRLEARDGFGRPNVIPMPTRKGLGIETVRDFQKNTMGGAA